MANTLVAKIEFYQSYGGTFVAGDYIEVFYDPDLDPAPVVGLSSVGVTARLNGITTLTTGPFLNTNAPNVLTFVNYNPVVCNGTRLMSPTFFSSFPYGITLAQPDHPTCQAVSPVPCSLAIQSTPVISPATPGQANGSITVRASTGNDVIRFKLNGDFVYPNGDSGTLVASSVFAKVFRKTYSNLPAGNYRIYVRDDKNCSDSYFVGLPNATAPDDTAVYYLLEYDDQYGDRTKIEILKRDYAGDPIEICAGAMPFTIQKRAEGEKFPFTSVITSQSTVTVNATENIEFSGIYTNDPDEYRIKFYKDTGGGYELQHVHKVLPRSYEEEYKATPYFVNILGTDGLASLKEFLLLQDDNQPFFGTTRLLDLISYILKKTGLTLPIRTACNLYATTMDQTDSDDPLDQSYSDYDTYYLSGAPPALDILLAQILEPFGAQLVQAGGRWTITRVDEMTAAYDYRDYDADGIYLGNGTYNPVIDITPAISDSAHWGNADQYITMVPGYGAIRVIYNLGISDNIIRNGDFRLKKKFDPVTNTYIPVVDTFGFLLAHSGETINEKYEVIDGVNVAYNMEGINNTILYGGVVSDGESFLKSTGYFFKMGISNQLKISIRYKVPTTYAGVFPPAPAHIPYQKLRIKVKYGNKYLYGDGSWNTTENEVVFYETVFDEYHEVTIVAYQPDTTYADVAKEFTISVFHSYWAHAEYENFDRLRERITVGVPEGTRTEAANGDFVYFYTLQNNTSSEIEPNIIRPDDYNASTNPYQWVQQTQFGANRGGLSFALTNSSHWIDFIKVTFLVDGADTIDAILQEVNAEPKNNEVIERTLIHGSFVNDIVSTAVVYQPPQPSLAAPLNLGLNIGSFTVRQKFKIGDPVQVTQSVLASNVLYRGFLRDADGNGFTLWTRDILPFQYTLAGIYIASLSAQFRRPRKQITGTFRAKTFFGMNNVLRETRDGTIYMAMSYTYNDKAREYQAELIELRDVTDSGNGGIPYSSGFTTGFGGGFN